MCAKTKSFIRVIACETRSKVLVNVQTSRSSIDFSNVRRSLRCLTSAADIASYRVTVISIDLDILVNERVLRASYDRVFRPITNR